MLADRSGEGLGVHEGMEAGMWGAPGDWHKRYPGDQWERMTLQTGVAHLQASNISGDVLTFSGKAELGMQKENRTGSRIDLGWTPVLRTTHNRGSYVLTEFKKVSLVQGHTSRKWL